MAKMGVVAMARPAPKPFDPNCVKSEAENAEETLKDAKFAAETGKAQINRGENLSNAAGPARHTLTDAVPDKKGT